MAPDGFTQFSSLCERWPPQRVCNKTGAGKRQVPGPCHESRNAWEQTISRRESCLFLNQNRTKCHTTVTVYDTFSLKFYIYLHSVFTWNSWSAVDTRLLIFARAGGRTLHSTLHFTTRRKLLRGGAVEVPWTTPCHLRRLWLVRKPQHWPLIGQASSITKLVSNEA